MLCLSYNDFYDFPHVVLSIKSLQNLNMIRNHLTLLPSDLCKLHCLTNLHLGKNSIIFLPDCFDSLSNLIQLTLEHNQLTSLPPTFSQLSNLEILDLSNNNFRAFPEQLLMLEKLSELKLHCNLIQSMSREELQFSDRIECSRHSNPCQNTNTSECPKPLRVLVVGGSNCGKTSLIKALCEKEYVNPNSFKKDSHTVGIDHYRYYFKKDEIDNNCELSLWDLAGERSYAMMNAMFLAQTALIWVVINIKEFMCDVSTYENMVGVWLRKIMSHCESERTVLPNIWIVATHMDECDSKECKNKKSFIQDCLFKSRSMSNKLLRDEFKNCEVLILSNVKLNGQSELVQCIARNAPIETCRRCDYHQWSSEEHRLYAKADEMIRNHQLPIMSLEELESQINVNDKCKFIEYLHGNGQILTLRFHSLSGEKINKVFLNVHWFAYILKQIFQHDLSSYISPLFSYRCDPEKIATVRGHLQRGEVGEETLERLWEFLKINPESRRMLIQILCDYSLFYLDPSKKFYVVPWLLPQSNKLSVRDLPLKALHITLRFTSDYIDPRFFEEILLSCDRENYDRNYWNTFHAITPDYELLVTCEKDLKSPEEISFDSILFHITANCEQSYSTLWRRVSEIIDKVTRIICHRDLKKIFPSYVMCPECIACRDSQPGQFLWQELLRWKNHRQSVICSRCRDKQRKEDISMIQVFPVEGMFLL